MKLEDSVLIKQLTSTNTLEVKVVREPYSTNSLPNVAQAELQVSSGDKKMIVMLSYNKNTMNDYEITYIWYREFGYTDEDPAVMSAILDAISSGQLVEKKTLFGFGKKRLIVQTKDGREHWPRN